MSNDDRGQTEINDKIQRVMDETNHQAYWRDQAELNVEEWELQEIDTVLLAIMEELGETAQAYLECEYEGKSEIALYGEIDDLAPLMWQLMWAAMAEYEDWEEES